MFVRIKSKIENFLERNRKYVMPIAIIGGFVGDIFTLNRIDQVFDNLVLIVHIFIVGLMIVFLFAKDSKYDSFFKSSKYESIYQTIMLFSFGGLFSGFVIFYTRSGSLLSAWPFILLMLLLMLGTEFYKSFYKRITFQIVLYFIALFAHMIFFIPLLVKDIGAFWFIVSGFFSLFLIWIFLRWLRKLNKDKFKNIRKNVLKYILGVFILFNFLYFTNTIPPVPLSLKFTAVYHNVERISDGYLVVFEPSAWLFGNKRSKTFFWDGVSPVYVFTSVFSPVGFDTEIHHVWKYFDTEKARWVKVSIIPISIKGGRVEGYRGFSYKNNVWPGKWRVVVENKRGQALGYINFNIKYGNPPRGLAQERI